MEGTRVRNSIAVALVVAATVVTPASASTIDYAASPGTTGPIPDNSPDAPLEVLFGVSGWSGPVENVSFSITAKHTWVGDLAASLAGPPGVSLIFDRPGVPQSTFGFSSDLDGTYTFSDTAPEGPSFETVAATNPVPPGIYRASASTVGTNSLLNPFLAGSSPNGVWRLRISDAVGGDTGEVTGAVLHITGPSPEATPTEPTPPAADTDPPDVTITKGAPNKTEKSRVKFKFESNEPGSTFECKKDKKPWKACSSPTKMKRLDEGKHRFKVRGTDAAGNTGPAAKDEFKVVS